MKNGVMCKTGDISSILKRLEKEQRLEVKRSPSLTKTKKPSTFMTEGHGQSVLVKWVN